MKKYLLIILLFGLSSLGLQAQKEEGKKAKKEKSYEDIISDKANSDSGLFIVHEVDEKFYYEIPDSLLGKEMLMVTRIAKTANGLGFGGGKQNTQVVRWEKNASNFCFELYPIKM